MGFKDISTTVTSKFSRQILQVQKHSPKILFVAGVVGVVGTVVLAARATLKVEDVLEKHVELMDKIDEAILDENDYTDQDAQKDQAIVFVKTALSLGRLYAPSVILGAFSIAALTGSHYILSNRLTNVTAAYAALDKGFRAYRARVVDELGVEKDAEFRYGSENKEIVEETPEGPVVTTVKSVAPGKSIYARFFDEGSTSWSRQYGQNQFFINCQQNYANDRLRARGHVFLNEVYDMLGFERTKEGAVVGWLYKGDGDGYIDFGIFKNNDVSVMNFLTHNERSILLDFNVDGIIYDKI